MAKQVNLSKDVFTTFEVAKICNANITSIKNWIEDGQIRAFRTPGGHYRIEKEVLVDFLNRFGMPNPFLKRDQKRILIFCDDPATVELVRRSVGRECDVEGTDNFIEAALLIGDKKPNCLVLEMKKGDDSTNKLVDKIRDNYTFNQVRIVAYAGEGVAPEDLPEDRQIEYFVRQSDGIEKLSDKVRQALV